MGFFDDIRYQQGLKKLKKTGTSPRSRRFLNYAESRTVGLIYKVKDVDQHDTIHQYIKHLKEAEGMKEVQALGFWDSKEEVPEFLSSRRHFDFFTRADVSKIHEPAGDNIEAYVNEPFDILIDLTFEEQLPLLFILKRSAARFKVGFPGDFRDPMLDLIMQVAEGKSLRECIEQVNYYLTILNRQAAGA
jgi:hypothetical protein